LTYWWTLGGFEFKEHIIAMGIALLPAYYIDSMKPIICGGFTISDVGSRPSALIRREG
jgi:hypothetical protein